MNFASDNTSGASPHVLEAIVRANAGTLPSYGGDPHSVEAQRRLCEIFAAEPAIALVATGTAANALALASVVPPGGVVFCHEHAHINDEECAAPEFYTAAGKLVGVPGENGKIDPDALRTTLRRFPRGVVRQAQGACLSISQATESGTLYTLGELRELTGIAHENGLVVHMDGARFANAVASFGCTPAAMSHEVGIDVLSFGATKNGTLACEAILVFDKAAGAALPFRQKRGGHVLSKGRFLGSQMAAYLEEGHWLDLARHANAMAKRLADGLQLRNSVRLPWTRQVNEVFAILPHASIARLREAGAMFYDWDPDYLPVAQRPGPTETFVRLLCSFATEPAEIDRFLELERAAD
ncbi:threonine aldolase family protein [Lichenifustis flavocetrariae]|uniref:L-threonine aldolase n=1 Tax=Lichenifustis flavocetrariae TaxID=2949735 RepID=A0AA41Z493_9HYPH|nr:beta-eliminating lyase-related protein [Lichenifustis flavocetrariae]MCW6510208.1 beta-eliminating lyase-related protein [Lichenifustis flavocetrariae]